MSNREKGTLYTGYSKDLKVRSYNHKSGRGCNFTKKYNLDKLVYYEVYKNQEEAAHREKRLKKYKRE